MPKPDPLRSGFLLAGREAGRTIGETSTMSKNAGRNEHGQLERPSA
jgi:hypothetical protein